MKNLTRGIGYRIKKAREANRVTQKELAEKIDVFDNSYISKLELEIRKPTVEDIIKLALVLNVTSDYLCGIDNPYEIISYELKTISIGDKSKIIFEQEIEIYGNKGYRVVAMNSQYVIMQKPIYQLTEKGNGN